MASLERSRSRATKASEPRTQRAIGAARAGEIERLAEHAVGVGEVAGARERFAELAAEDEDRAHRIVELAAEDLAAREVEAAAERRGRSPA